MSTNREKAVRLVVRCAVLATLVAVASPVGAATSAPTAATGSQIVVKVHQTSGKPANYFALTVAAGKRTVAGLLEVVNATDKPQVVNVDPVDAITSETLGSAYETSGRPMHGSTPWLRLGSRRVRIAPHASVSVMVAVDVPSSAKPGDYLSGISVQAEGQGTVTEPSKNVMIGQVYRYAVGFETTIPGPRTPHLAFEGATVVREPSSIVFRLHAKNDGNVILQNVHGDVKIMQGDRVAVAQDIARGTFVTDTSIAFPVRAPKEQPAEGTKYRIRAHLAWDGGVASLDTSATFAHADAVKQQQYPKPVGAAAHSSSSSIGGTAVKIGFLVLLLGLAFLVLLWRRRNRVPDRAATEALLERELAAIDSHHRPVSAMNFGAIPRRVGKRGLVKLLRPSLRKGDTIGDLGRAGLLVVLPNASSVFADACADQVTELVRDSGRYACVEVRVATAVALEDVDAFIAGVLERPLHGTRAGRRAAEIDETAIERPGARAD